MLKWVTQKQVDAAANAVMNKKGLDKLEEITDIMEKKLLKAYVLTFLTAAVPPALFCSLTGLSILSCILAAGWFAASMTISSRCFINPRVLREYQEALSKESQEERHVS